uniref:Uncharacterized protein n=1 Tax=Arundo donax TaxID=35708 RepID=A0A0A9ENK4_ARUDO
MSTSEGQNLHQTSFEHVSSLEQIITPKTNLNNFLYILWPSYHPSFWYEEAAAMKL